MNYTIKDVLTQKQIDIITNNVIKNVDILRRYRELSTEEQIKALDIIIDPEDKAALTQEYRKEKLERIKQGTMVFHSLIVEAIIKEMEEA